MNVNDLKDIYNDNREEIIKRTIADTNESIEARCKNGFDYVYRDSDDCYLKMESIYVEDWLIDVLKDHYENNGFKVYVITEEIKPFFIRRIFNRIIGRKCEPKSYRKLYIGWDFGGK